MTEMIVRLRTIRLELKNPAIRRGRLLQPALGQQRVPQIVMDIRVVGCDGESLAIRLYGFLQPASILERVAQVIVSLEKIRLQFERPAVRRDRFIEPAQGPICSPEIRVGRIIGRVKDDGLFNQIHRPLMLSTLARNDAEILQRRGMLWLHREDLPVKALGVRQPSGLVVLERESEGLLDRSRGHGRNGEVEQHTGQCPNATPVRVHFLPQLVERRFRLCALARMAV